MYISLSFFESLVFYTSTPKGGCWGCGCNALFLPDNSLCLLTVAHMFWLVGVPSIAVDQTFVMCCHRSWKRRRVACVRAILGFAANKKAKGKNSFGFFGVMCGIWSRHKCICVGIFCGNRVTIRVSVQVGHASRWEKQSQVVRQ